MKQKSYSITELEQITGLSRRTIHFYIQEKVIPPSEGTGGSAKYSDEHVLRLGLVKQMQESHLKLAGIKEALAGLSLEELKSLSKATKKRPSRKWNSQAVREWLVGGPKKEEADDIDSRPRFSLRRKTGNSDRTGDSVIKYSLKDDVVPSQKEGKLETGNDVRYSVGDTPPLDKQKSWERIEIVDGVEMNVRSDIAHENAEDLKAIVEKLRQIMKGDFIGS